MRLRMLVTNLLPWGRRLVFILFFTLTTVSQAQVNPAIINSNLAKAPVVTPAAEDNTFSTVHDISRRLEELEQEGAQRNGSVERMQFAIEAIARRVDEVQKDYDLRLNDLERKLQVLQTRPMAAPVAAAVSTTAPISITVPANISSTVLYNKAYAYLTATQYRDAEAWLLEFTKRFPAEPLADNAFYWLGESRLVQNNPAGAVQAFRDGLKSFPKGQKAPDNLFKMGVALEQLKQPQLAKVAWEKLLKEYPANALAERAKARLAGLKL
jgi:tol-pal system protein YbgF